MDNGYESEVCFGNVFRFFVFVVLSLLLGLQIYPYLWNSQDGLEGDFTDVKYVIMQLTKGLTEVNRKHEKLHSEMKRISEALPSVTAAASRAQESLEASRYSATNVDVYDNEHQVADFALETAGARVIDTGNTVEHFVYESPVGWVLYAISSLLCRGCLGATTMIQPGTLPGECWAFKGAQGEAAIRLIGNVHITSFSLEHIPAHISPRGEISSAPRLIQLYGLETLSDPNPHDFGTFQYDKDGEPNQYFEVNPTTKGYNLVRLRILSNWGHSEYTCVYRFRVHGQLAEQTSTNDEDELQIENES